MRIGGFGNRHYFAPDDRNSVRRNLAFWRVLDDVPIVISWRLCRQIGAIADGEMEIIARTACQIWTIPSPAAHGAHRSQDKHQAESPQPAHCKFRAILLAAHSSSSPSPPTAAHPGIPGITWNSVQHPAAVQLRSAARATARHCKIRATFAIPRGHHVTVTIRIDRTPVVNCGSRSATTDSKS